MTDLIRLDLLGAFGGFRLNAQAEIPAKGVTAIMGSSATGKTTLLRCLAGLARAEGRIAVDGRIWQDGDFFLPTHERGVGYVFQEPSLLPHLSVKGNLDYAARRAGDRPGPGFGEVAAMLGLEKLLHRTPEALSGGERQRVAIGRALLSKPVLLLMDEPLSSLDAGSKAEVLPYLEQLHKALSLPIIYVSHDEREVAHLADRVIRMDGGRLGPVVAQGNGCADPLDALDPRQVRALARAALAAGLETEDAT